MRSHSQSTVGHWGREWCPLQLTTLIELRDGRIARVHQYDTLT